MKNLLVQGWTRDTITTLAETTYTQAEQALEKKGGDTRYPSTSWGLFNEDVRTVTVERLGRTLYNVETGRIEAFAAEEQLYNHYNFDPVVFAWNMDPKTIAGINPYEVFGNNPVLYVDPLGDIFKVSGQSARHMQGAKEDVKDLARTTRPDGTKTDNSRYVKFQQDGTVYLDFGSMDRNAQAELIAGDVGLSLIHDLITAKDEQTGRELTFVYHVGNSISGRSRFRNFKIDDVSETGGIRSISRTPKRIGIKTGEDPNIEEDYEPSAGIDGFVHIPMGRFLGFNQINPRAGGNGYQVRRASIVYHELRENWFRTVKLMPYRRAETNLIYRMNRSCGYYQGYSGAHNAAVDSEGGAYDNPDPGGFGCQEEEK